MDPSVIRVFISSTFKDMHVERERLVKIAFPQIRAQCRQHAHEFVDVDLRWGIPDEGQQVTLPMCLQQVDRCQIFIGILGEYYGSEFDQMTDHIAAQYPWTADYVGRSFTELEILHWLRNHQGQPQQALFYFRDPAYLDTLSDNERQLFGDTSAERRRKLAELKAHIRASGARVEEYATPDDLAELVLVDLSRIIEREFLTIGQASADQQIAIARRFALGYVPDQADFDVLSDHVQGDGPPVIVTGAPGSGKSALLANWSLLPEADSADLTIRFFSGFDLTTMLQHVINALRDAFDISQPVPEHPAALAANFGSWLHRVPPGKRVTLVLDGIAATDWSWLPMHVPASVRLILGVEPGPGLDDLRARDWPELRISPLNDHQQRTITAHYLQEFGKQLSAQQLDRICAAEQTTNPLFLRVFLAEMRVFGNAFSSDAHTTALDQRIDDLLDAGDASALYDRVLQRYEADYERTRPGLVREAMLLIAAAHRGLTESELLELLGPGEGQPLPQAIWTPLYNAASEALMLAAGKLTFAHPTLRQAAEQHYLTSDMQRQGVHEQLADYFEDRLALAPHDEQLTIQRLRRMQNELGDDLEDELETALGDVIGAFDVDVRVIQELPWQLIQIPDWDRLHALLTDPRFVANAWTESHAEILSLWTTVEAHTNYRLADAYRNLPETYKTNHLVCIANLLYEAGLIGQALTLNQLLNEKALAGDNQIIAILALANTGSVYLKLHQLDEASECFEKSIALAEKLGIPPSTNAMQGRADILRSRGDVASSRRIHQQELELARATGDVLREKDALDNLSAFEQRSGSLDRALELAIEVERLCTILGDLGGLQQTLGRQAQIVRERAEFDVALDLLDRRKAICEQTNNLIGLSMVMSDQAVTYMERGEHEAALSLLKEQEQLCVDIGVVSHQIHCLANQAECLVALDQLDEALELSLKQEALARDTEHLVGLARSLSTQSRIMRAKDQPARALELLEEQEAVCREANSNKGLVIALVNKSDLLLQEFGNVRDALVCAEEAYQLAKDSGLTTHLKNATLLRDVLRQMHNAGIVSTTQLRGSLPGLGAAGRTAHHTGNIPTPPLKVAHVRTMSSTPPGAKRSVCRVCGTPTEMFQIECPLCGITSATRNGLRVQWVGGSIMWFVIGAVAGIIAARFGLHLPVSTPLFSGAVATLYYTFFQFLPGNTRDYQAALQRRDTALVNELVMMSPHVIDLPAAEVAERVGARDIATVEAILRMEREKRGL